MFPEKCSGFARRWPQDPQFWVGVVSYVYPDLRQMEEVLETENAPGRPILFTSMEEATQAAEIHGEIYRLSDRLELLTGVYSGDS